MVKQVSLQKKKEIQSVLRKPLNTKLNRYRKIASDLNTIKNRVLKMFQEQPEAILNIQSPKKDLLQEVQQKQKEQKQQKKQKKQLKDKSQKTEQRIEKINKQDQKHEKNNNLQTISTARPDIEFYRMNQVKKINQQLIDLCKAQKATPPMLAFERWRWRQKYQEDYHFYYVQKQENHDLQYSLDYLFPHTNNNDPALIISLTSESKISKQNADRISKAIIKSTNQTIEQIKQKQTKKYNGSVVIYDQQQYLKELKEGGDENITDQEIENANFYNIIYSPDGKTQNQKQLCQLQKTHYNKLLALFSKNNPQFTQEQIIQLFPDYLYSLLARYKCLQGPGSQAAVPEGVFKILQNEFETYFECFASPMNCYLEKNYCSAFSDTDIPFGSKGNFFNYMPKYGSFQANPPFIPEIMLGMVLHMEKIIQNAGHNPISFCIIVPFWEKQDYWEALTQSKYQTRMFTIKKEDHKYKEGLQHERNRYRESPFDTGFFFLQNEQGKEKWAVTDRHEKLLRNAMSGSK